MAEMKWVVPNYKALTSINELTPEEREVFEKMKTGTFEWLQTVSDQDTDQQKAWKQYIAEQRSELFSAVDYSLYGFIEEVRKNQFTTYPPTNVFVSYTIVIPSAPTEQMDVVQQ
jgi:hypothetical protein